MDEITEQLRKLRDELDNDWNDAWQFVPKPKAKAVALEVKRQTGNEDNSNDDNHSKTKSLIIVEEEEADGDAAVDAKELAWRNHLLESERVEL